MATIIKFQRKGTLHKSFWRIVVTDERKPKGCIEQIGTYDNHRKPVQIRIDEEKAARWISLGARPSESVKQLFKKQGIMKKAMESRQAESKA
jgi:small subunit ribosomal protein S16